MFQKKITVRKADMFRYHVSDNLKLIQQIKNFHINKL
jgi:hypothetical protein